MKTKINGFEVEGTVDEIKQILSLNQEKKIVVKPPMQSPHSKVKPPMQITRSNSRANKKWTEEEKNLLLDLVSKGKSMKYIAQKLNRKTHAVIQKKCSLYSKLGLKNNNAFKKWSAEEKSKLDFLIKQNYTNETIAGLLNRSVGAIKFQRHFYN